MNKLKCDLFYLYGCVIVQILVNVQIFSLVGGNSSSNVPPTRGIFEYTLVKLYNEANLPKQG